MIKATVTYSLGPLTDGAEKVRAAVLDTIKRLQYMLVAAAHAAFDAAPLHSRTGHLKGSIQPGPIEEAAGSISGGIVAGGGDAFYARIHEYGGEIVPKNVKFLTVPLDAAKTAMGVSRFSAREVIASPTSYGYSGTFFKHQVLFGTGKGKGGITPLFALKTHVTIPERSYMRKALGDLQPIIYLELEKAVQEAVK